MTRAAKAREVALLFLRLGCTAFGGPAAHIAMVEQEVVHRRKWITPEEFLDLLGAVNLIPGPNSTELAILIGYRRAGWAGLLLAGFCFILPAASMVTALAWMYVKHGALPAALALFDGIKPVLIAIVIQALWSLGRTALKSIPLGIIGSGVALLNLAGFGELPLLLASGLGLALIRQFRTGQPIHPGNTPLLAASLPEAGIRPAGELAAGSTTTVASAALAAGTGTAGLMPLFLSFLKIGSVLYGSGYVLLAYLRAEFVENHRWLTDLQLLDAVAVGQVTPGPLLTTATFVGYLLQGFGGALAATVGIFLPAFLLVAASGPLIPRIRSSPLAAAFLDGVNVASLGLMFVVSLELGRSAIRDWTSLGIATASGLILFRYRLNSIWLVLGGAMIGWLRLQLP